MIIDQQSPTYAGQMLTFPDFVFSVRAQNVPDETDIITGNNTSTGINITGSVGPTPPPQYPS